MPHVADLHRYPVKGLSPEPLPFLDLTRDAGLAHDRAYALALGTTAFDEAHPVPLDKGHFLMLRAHESLAALRTRLDPATHVLDVSRDGASLLRADLSTPQGREAAGAFFTDFAGPAAPGARAVSASCTSGDPPGPGWTGGLRTVRCFARRRPVSLAARVAQRESTSLTRRGSQVQSLSRAPGTSLFKNVEA